MKKYSAIALIEFSNVVTGIRSSDAMVKRAPIAMIKMGTVSKGRFLVLVGGSMASVNEAYTEGLSIGEGSIVDSLILSDVHLQVHDAILGERRSCSEEGIAICETKTVASLIRCTDAAIKGASVDIVEMRLADALGGKAFVVFSGKVENLEFAIKIAQANMVSQNILIGVTIIPKVHNHIAKQINRTTRFAAAEPLMIEDGEM